MKPLRNGGLYYKESKMEPYAVIAYVLWNEHGYDLPDSPGNMAAKILQALEEASYDIVSTNTLGGNDGEAPR